VIGAKFQLGDYMPGKIIEFFAGGSGGGFLQKKALRKLPTVIGCSFLKA
jgi:hypothetical protein